MFGKSSSRQRYRVTALPFLLLIFLFAGFSQARAATVYGVNTSNQLVRFDTASPGAATVIGQIGGLSAGETIVGIDFRPAGGQLFALSSASRLYTINLTTGIASGVGLAGSFTLSGSNFGFDFNPTVDRIRVVSNTGQNLRLNPLDGSLAAADPNLNPGTPSVTAAAYTNNFAGATTTTLFVIDSGNDTLYQQNPANNGTLVAVGALGVNTSGVNGFDIGSDGTAYAALTVGGVSNLYTINLNTGAATLVGAIGGGDNLTGISVVLTGSGGNTTGTGNANFVRVLDFDGDRRSDFAVFRLTTNTWFVLNSGNGTFFGRPFGQAQTDTLTPADYDGDGKTDIAVFRDTNGTFYVLRSSDSTVQIVQFGAPGDEPVARDYSGDNRADFAVVRRSGATMTWFVLNSATLSFSAAQFGLATDVVAPGDYDGDGRFDLAVFRGTDDQPGTFFVQRSNSNTLSIQQFGRASDLVVPGDYDGDGKYDFAVVRPGTNYNWSILRSSNGTVYNVQFGAKPDAPAQADYDGDGRTDVTVFRNTNGTFFGLRSADQGLFVQQFGASSDIPVAGYDTH
jgi:hypothetical protein